MTDTSDIIIKLKQVREQKGLSYGDILNLLEKNGDFLSKSTLSRVFQEGSENLSFRYEETIRPIAKALLDIETIEADDNLDIQVMKTLLQYKIQRIEELEWQLENITSLFENERSKMNEKLEHERSQWSKSIEFLKEQIFLKDQRMDILLKAIQNKDTRYDSLLELVLSCPCRKAVNEKEKRYECLREKNNPR